MRGEALLRLRWRHEIQAHGEAGDVHALRLRARCLRDRGFDVPDPDANGVWDLPEDLFTTDAETLILGADVVIELMGGIEPARSHILMAINSGADVVTANKALLATHGPELFAAADQVGAQLKYEAAVAGAIPASCAPETRWTFGAWSWPTAPATRTPPGSSFTPR